MTPRMLSQADLEAMIRHTPDGIVVVDGEGITRFVNPAAEALFGLGAGDLVDQVFGHPLGTGERTEIEIIRGFKEPVHAEMNLASITWQKAPATLISLRDITARKGMETALKESETSLRDAKAAADAANRAKSEFLANMSHELRTPLNAILGYAQLLLQDEGLAADQRDAAETIHHSGEHLLTLISDLLDIAKIEAGKVRLEPATFDFSAFLQGTFEPMAFSARRKGVDLLLDADPNLPGHVRGDEKRLRQVLFNLLSNAVKFTEKGRVTLAVRYEDGTAHFEVVDTGIGISPDALSTIFHPFEQATAPLQGGDGTGLGLAISVNLVRLMGGDLAVKSTPGQGSTFRFEIPLERAAPDPAAGAAAAANPFKVESEPIRGPGGRQFTALIVDDNALNRALAKGMMTRLGFQVTESQNGADAVEKTVDSRPDVVLLDLLMPVMDGFSAVPEMRRRTGGNGPVIMAVSADVSRETQNRCAEIGCDDFVEKPIAFEGLARKLRHHLVKATPPEPAVPSESGGAAADNEDRKALADLAAVGDIVGIRRLAEQLKPTDPDRAGFYDQLIASAAAFHMEKIEALLGIGPPPEPEEAS